MRADSCPWVVACLDSAWSCCCSAARCRPGAAARTAGRRGPAPVPGRVRRVLPRRRREGAPGRHPRLAGAGLRRPARRPRELRQERRSLVVQGAPGQPQRRRPGRFPGGQLPAAGRPQGLPADRRWAHRTAGERRPIRLLPAPGAGAQLLVPAATAARREHPAAARAEQQHRLRAAVLQHLRGQRGQPGNPDGLQRGLLRVLFGLFCYNLFLRCARPPTPGTCCTTSASACFPPASTACCSSCCPDTWRWSRPASTC